jgi:hypothetical protein
MEWLLGPVLVLSALALIELFGFFSPAESRPHVLDPRQPPSDWRGIDGH